MKVNQIIEQLFDGAERMKVDIKSTFDLTDESFDALKSLL